MTESTNSKTATFSFLGEQSPSIVKTSQDCYATQNQIIRRLAWQVAPNLFLSFKYAWAGVRYAFVTQRNFRIHTVIGCLAVSLGLWLSIRPVEMAVIVMTCAMVMVLELINTAIESVVDLTVKQTYHDLAKIAKDCAAGAVLISAVAAVLVAAFILLPPLFRLVMLTF